MSRDREIYSQEMLFLLTPTGLNPTNQQGTTKKPIKALTQSHDGKTPVYFTTLGNAFISGKQLPVFPFGHRPTVFTPKTNSKPHSSFYLHRQQELAGAEGKRDKTDQKSDPEVLQHLYWKDRTDRLVLSRTSISLLSPQL